MTRSWRIILAASLFCSASGLAHAALPDKPGTTQRVLKVYRRSYSGQAQRFVTTRKVVGEVQRAREALSYSNGYDFHQSELLEEMAHSTSKEELISRFRTELEQQMLEDASGALRQPGKVRRFFGAKTQVATIDREELERSVAKFSASLGSLEQQITALDAALTSMPRYLSRGIVLGPIYGNERLKTKDARLAFLKKLGDASERFTGSRDVGLQRMEKVLQLRITEQIKRDQQAQREHDESAPPIELHAEAMQLIQDVRNAVSEELPRAETVHSSGSGTTVSQTNSVSRSQLNLGHDRAGNAITIKSPFSTLGSSTTRSSSSWSAVGEQLTSGADYVLKLSSSKVPLYADGSWGDGHTVPTESVILPVEARMILEKVVRISEIHLALSKRDAGLAASIAPWVTGSRFILLEPEQQMDSYNSRPKVKALSWSRGGVVLGSRIKADLSSLGGESFLDPVRAKMFKDELESRLTSGLK